MPSTAARRTAPTEHEGLPPSALTTPAAQPARLQTETRLRPGPKDQDAWDTGPKDAWEARLHLTERCSGDILLMALRKMWELASQGKGIFWECP